MWLSWHKNIKLVHCVMERSNFKWLKEKLYWNYNRVWCMKINIYVAYTFVFINFCIFYWLINFVVRWEHVLPYGRDYQLLSLDYGFKWPFRCAFGTRVAIELVFASVYNSNLFINWCWIIYFDNFLGFFGRRRWLIGNFRIGKTPVRRAQAWSAVNKTFTKTIWIEETTIVMFSTIIATFLRIGFSALFSEIILGECVSKLIIFIILNRWAPYWHHFFINQKWSRQ